VDLSGLCVRHFKELEVRFYARRRHSVSAEPDHAPVSLLGDWRGEAIVDRQLRLRHFALHGRRRTPAGRRDHFNRLRCATRVVDVRSGQTIWSTAATQFHGSNTVGDLCIVTGEKPRILESRTGNEVFAFIDPRLPAPETDKTWDVTASAGAAELLTYDYSREGRGNRLLLWRKHRPANAFGIFHMTEFLDRTRARLRFSCGASSRIANAHEQPRRFQFSLRTLALGALLIGSGGTLYLNSEPWRIVPRHRRARHVLVRLHAGG